VRPRAAALSVGHFFREVDSAVRHALTPREPATKSKGCDGGHAANISAILRVLEISESDPRAALWKKFANKKDPWHLTTFAHRRGLGATRPFDSEFETLCADFDALLTFVLDRIRASAAKLAKKLNEILAITAPTADDIKTLRNNVPAAPFIFDRLFDVRLTANWIDGLLADGFFAEPPPGAPVPAAMFALRLSETDTVRARNILEQLPTVDDVFMGNAFMVTMQRLGRDAYPVLFEKTLAWVEGPGFVDSGPHLYPQFSRLIVHLGAYDDVARVLALTGALTVVTPPSNNTNPYFHDPESHLDVEEYNDVLGAGVEALCARDPIALVNLMSDRLETTLDMMFDPPVLSPNGNQDISESWLANFDDPEAHAYSIKQVLAKRLAEALLRASAADPGQVAALAQALQTRRFCVFRRLEAHLLLHADSDADHLSDAVVCDARNFWSIAPQLEFAELLRRRFPHLDVPAKQLVLDHITVEIDPSTINEDATDDDRRELGERRVKNYLTLLTGHLPPAYDERLAQLDDSLGASTDLVSQVHGPAHAIAPESPWTNDHFRSFSAAESADALLERPFALGAADQLREAIADEPGRFVPALASFQRLDPAYLRYIILGFSLALSRRNPFDWSAVIQFAHHIVTHAVSAPEPGGEAASDWSAARYEVCTLIADGTTGQFPSFERSDRGAVLAIIERVLVDEPQNVVAPSEFESVLSRSLSDTRAAALRALIGVVLLFRETAPHADLDLREGVRSQPDAAALLLRFLAEADASIYVMFGERFDVFCRLDRSWARTIVPLVFPTSEDPDVAMFAAWESFVTLCAARWYTHDLLAEQYAFAARVWPIREATSNPDFSYPPAICTHLLILFFAYGRLSPKADFAPLFARVSDKTVGRAMFRIARFLEGFQGDDGTEHIARIMGFWAWCKTRAASAPTQHDEELQGFGSWFCTMKLPEAWALDELKQVLVLTGGAIHPGHEIVKCLRKVSDDGLAAALGCLILLIQGRAATHNLFFWADDIRALLLRTHAVNETLAQTSREIAGRLTAKRIGGFDDLFG